MEAVGVNGGVQVWGLTFYLTTLFLSLRMAMAINDDKWKILFQRHDIVAQVDKYGHFDISAQLIKEVREPRLMCKMDFREKVPKPFRDHGLSILAIQNGLYRIAKTSPFFDIDTKQIGAITTVDFELPHFITTLDHENITGESQALDAAFASGMLNALLGEESYLTVRGRRYCTEMTVSIPNVADGAPHDYPVASVQIEVDGGYEGANVLALIEAKMGTADNMNMRQLIYPHVHFETTTEKRIRTFVMFYEAGSIFIFIPMLYADGKPNLDYLNATRYHLIGSTHAPAQAVPQITLPSINYDAPSPQADDFSKILFSISKLAEIQPATPEELFQTYPIVPRQYAYYSAAIRWLGVAEKVGNRHSLTDFGEALLSMPEKQRIKILRQQMLQDSVFSKLVTNPNYEADNDERDRWGVNLTTYRRRRSTALAWLKATEALLS